MKLRILFLLCSTFFLTDLATGSTAIVGDECDFIRQAIDRGKSLIAVAPAGGDDGIYECAAPIVIDRDNVTLMGVGAERVRLRLAPQSLVPLLIVGSVEMGANAGVVAKRVMNIHVENFELDGNRLQQIPAQSGDFYQDAQGRTFEATAFIKRQRQAECWGGRGCDLENDPRSVIRNNGITIRGADGVTLKNILSKNNLSGGLVTEKKSAHLYVNGFESFNNLFDGFAGYETKYSEFRNMNLHHNFASGVSLDLDFNFNSFSDSDFSNNQDNGIFARQSRSNKFSDIKIKGACNNGIFLADSGAGVETAARDYLFVNIEIEAMAKAIRINNSTCENTKIYSSYDLKFIGLDGDISLAEGASAEVNGGYVSSLDSLNNHKQQELSLDEIQNRIFACRAASYLSDSPDGSI